MNAKIIAELKTYKAIYDDAEAQMGGVLFGDDVSDCINAQQNAQENIFKLIDQL